MVKVPQKAQQKALKILPRGSKYFGDIRKRFLVSQASEDEQREKKLHMEVQMIDVRIIS